MTPRVLFLPILLAVASCGALRPSGPAPEAARWWKGNLHTHSLWSDGDHFPEMAVDWYHARGYDFLALSDHNTLGEEERWRAVDRLPGGRRSYDAYLARFGPEWVETRTRNDSLFVRLRRLSEYRSRFEAPGRFLLLRSEEISDRFGSKPVHLNAHNLREYVAPQGGGSVREVMQNNVDAVLEQRRRTGQPMFPHINHPNFVWAVTAEDLIALEGERFFEVYNGHPLVHNEGDDLRPGTERLWDIVLTARLAAGRDVMYGLATDDTHQYHDHSPDRANPGRGWVMVRADSLTPEALVHALEAGDFYASTGVVLDDVRVERGRYALRIRPEPGVRYTTRFIGTRRGYDARTEPVQDTTGAAVTRRYSDDVGVVLAEVEGAAPVYHFRGDELYVRATVVSSKPKAGTHLPDERERAWTQPAVGIAD